MFNASWATAVTTRRIRWIAALAMALLAVTAGLWVFRHAPNRLADRRDPNCQKFQNMLNDSSHTADSIYTRVDSLDNPARGNEGDFMVWTSIMQHDAAQITGGGELAQWAGILAADSGEVYRLFVEAERDPSPEAERDRSPDAAESPPDWMTEYNEISRHFDIARDLFRVDCKKMKLE
jgi:hypothetical protein